ncbi:hypothetical protein Hypma_002549 [Hypsizygus marmoreus]|uniref:H-type lectin domain-containing protein n=1 Tax=Hypsizygus marmoreus TaxID=39966 RepID=A0A369J6X4_HYPMA|nr:hypothetical protein Hypma_002549 [Hypsizygus marmoreus]
MSPELLDSFAISQPLSKSQPEKKATSKVSFELKFPLNPPTIPLGLTALDINKNHGIRVKAYLDNLTRESVTVRLDGWGDTVLNGAMCNWLPFYTSDRELQSGSASTLDVPTRTPSQATTAIEVTFPKGPFAAPPLVVVWLNMLDFDEKHNWRIKATASDITCFGFVMHLDTWGDTILNAAAATWIAYPANLPNIMSGSFKVTDVRPWHEPRLENKGSAQFRAALQTTPGIRGGLNMLDIACKADLRIKVGWSNVDETGLEWNIDSWSDTILYDAGASYIALQLY